MEIFYNPSLDKLSTVRFAAASSGSFFIGIEICEFISAIPNRPYYIFSGLKDEKGRDRKWFFLSGTNLFVDVDKIDQGDIFRSPLRRGFEIVAMEQIRPLLIKNFPKDDAAIMLARLQQQMLSAGINLNL